MFIRRRKLLLIILGLGTLWAIVTTIISKSAGKDDTHGHQHTNQQRSVGKVLDKHDEQYYDDENEIDVVENEKPTPKHKIVERPVEQRIEHFVHKKITKRVFRENEELEELVKRDRRTERPSDSNPATLDDKPLFAEVAARPKHTRQRTPKISKSSHAAGRNGSAVLLNDSELSPEDKQLIEAGWKKHAHNEFVSRMISVRRSLPDVRDASCVKINYDESLPNASVIIVFYNEAWTTLLRTIHSVNDRSPSHLLHELILVDDNSDEVHLQQQLDDYVALLPKVRLIRSSDRMGVIRARQHGAELATGAVLIFLDSHCECTTGWLEPLLARIAESKTTVAMPIMDIIDDATFQYKSFDANSANIGGFDWNLQFTWISISDREKQRRSSLTDSIRTPSMSGGMYAIDRNWFSKLGGYDTGMDMWGAENLEMSFRVWMCGGSMEVVPCSHVGHLFRRRTTYQLHGDGTSTTHSRKNYFRLAEVWMDDYKEHFYEKIGGRPKDDENAFGDITQRKRLRKELHCQSFDWYLKNVYPELFIPANALALGEIRSRDRVYIDKQGYPACLDSIVGPNAYNQPVKIWPCHGQGGNQFWLLSAIGEIRRDDGCMDYAGKSVVIYPCHGQRGNQEWQYTEDGMLRHRSTKLCLGLSADGTTLTMTQCAGGPSQLWLWKKSSLMAQEEQNADNEQKLKPTRRSKLYESAKEPLQELAKVDY